MEEQLEILGKRFHFENSYLQDPIDYDFLRLYEVGEIHCEQEYNAARQKYDYHKIIYIISGEAEITINSTTHNAHRGDIIIVRRGQTSGINAAKESDLHYFYLGLTFIEDYFEEYHTIFDFFNLKKRDYKARDVRGVFVQFANLMTELHKKGADHHILIRNYLTTIIVQIWRCFNVTESKKNIHETNINAVGDVIYAVLKYIDRHLDEIDSIEEICSGVGYSQQYISRLFKKKTEITVQDYLRIKRIERALELLESERYSITDISVMLKYESVQAFTKAFRKTLGINPTQYKIAGNLR